MYSPGLSLVTQSFLSQGFIISRSPRKADSKSSFLVLLPAGLVLLETGDRRLAFVYIAQNIAFPVRTAQEELERRRKRNIRSQPTLFCRPRVKYRCERRRTYA